MTAFFIGIVSSFIGQIAALWIIGFMANRKEAERAREIQKIVEEELHAKNKRMREYAEMES